LKEGQKLIVEARKAGQSFHEKTHAAGIHALKHVDLHHDPILANDLIKAMPEGARKNAMRLWFEKNGKLKFSRQKKEFVYHAAYATRLDNAEAEPFWKTVKEAEYKPYDAMKAFQSFITKAENKANEPGEKDKLANPEFLLKAKRLLAEYSLTEEQAAA
jgi:hypothetical protein